MEIKEELGSKFSFLYRKRLIIISQKLKDLNINTNQSILLVNAGRNPGLTQNQLSKLLSIEKTNLSKILKTLESRELINKKYESHDKRYAQIYLSKKGMELLKEIRRRLGDLWNLHLEKVSLEEQEIFISIMNKIIKNIDYKL